MMSNTWIHLLALIVAAGFIFKACDATDSGPEGPTKAQVMMKVDQNSENAKFLASSEHENTISIQEVKLFVDELELDGTHGTSDFEIEYFIVNLPLDGTPVTLIDQEIPAGFYDEFELEIEKPDDDDIELDDRDFRDETGSYSVVVKGIFNGEEFTFRSSEDFEIDIDLVPPIEIGEGESSTIVVSVDVGAWFLAADGTVLDPKDFRNTETINDNIERSFEVFEEMFDD